MTHSLSLAILIHLKPLRNSPVMISKYKIPDLKWIMFVSPEANYT